MKDETGKSSFEYDEGKRMKEEIRMEDTGSRDVKTEVHNTQSTELDEMLLPISRDKAVPNHSNEFV
jgi:hypothetical protein